MSIAEKLVTVAENQQRVFDAGIEQGKQAEYDRFWDIYQDNGNRKSYSCAFAGYGWTTENCKPKYNMQPTDAYMMFRENQSILNIPDWLAENGVTLDFSKSTSIQYAFARSKVKVLGVIDCSSTKSLYATFDHSEVTTIEKLILAEGTTFDSCFTEAYGLTNLTVEGVISNNLSLATGYLLTRVSALSVINALKDYSGTGTNRTLTLHSKAKERLTSADIAIATQKGWTIA